MLKVFFSEDIMMIVRSTNFDDKSLSANFFHKVKVFRDS